MQSLRRKQQAEENKIRIDAEGRRKKEEEARKDEEKLKKKEEEKTRREAILEQFKMKKEMEKMEQEVCVYAKVIELEFSKTATHGIISANSHFVKISIFKNCNF